MARCPCTPSAHHLPPPRTRLLPLPAGFCTPVYFAGVLTLPPLRTLPAATPFLRHSRFAYLLAATTVPCPPLPATDACHAPLHSLQPGGGSLVVGTILVLAGRTRFLHHSLFCTYAFRTRGTFCAADTWFAAWLRCGSAAVPTRAGTADVQTLNVRLLPLTFLRWFWFDIFSVPAARTLLLIRAAARAALTDATRNTAARRGVDTAHPAFAFLHHCSPCFNIRVAF